MVWYPHHDPRPCLWCSLITCVSKLKSNVDGESLMKGQASVLYSCVNVLWNDTLPCLARSVCNTVYFWASCCIWKPPLFLWGESSLSLRTYIESPRQLHYWADVDAEVQFVCVLEVTGSWFHCSTEFILFIHGDNSAHVLFRCGCKTSTKRWISRLACRMLNRPFFSSTIKVELIQKILVHLIGPSNCYSVLVLDPFQKTNAVSIMNSAEEIAHSGIFTSWLGRSAGSVAFFCL